MGLGITNSSTIFKNPNFLIFNFLFYISYSLFKETFCLILDAFPANVFYTFTKI